MAEYTIPYAGGTLSLPSMNDHNYGVNQNVIQYVGWGAAYTKTVKMGEIGSTSQLPMVFDCTMGITATPVRIFNANDPDIYSTDVLKPQYARHINGSNILFADGHAKFLQQSKMIKDNSRASLNYKYWYGIPMYIEDDRVQ